MIEVSDIAGNCITHREYQPKDFSQKYLADVHKLINFASVFIEIRWRKSDI